MIDIKKTIRRHGYTLDGVAKEMGVSKSSMTQYLHGNPTLSTLQSIADVLGIPVSDLLRDYDSDSPAVVYCPHCGKPIQVKLEAK